MTAARIVLHAIALLGVYMLAAPLIGALWSAVT